MKFKKNKNIITEEFDFYPLDNTDTIKIKEIIQELQEVLLERSDGVSISLIRTKEFPKHNGKFLIREFQVKTWDIAA